MGAVKHLIQKLTGLRKSQWNDTDETDFELLESNYTLSQDLSASCTRGYFCIRKPKPKQKNCCDI